MRIALASDHAGFTLKNTLVTHLKEKGFEVIDFGPNQLEKVDYPDYARLVGHAIVNKQTDTGILVCGSGIGMSIAANKVKGIRAAMIYDEVTAKLAKEHNHANIITIGERLTPEALALKMVDIFLATQEDTRHNQRIEKISELELEEDECCGC